MLTARASRWGMLLAVLAVGAQANAAPDAAAIMRKAGEAMMRAKTYQATWAMTSTMGTMGSLQMNMEVRTIPASGKTFLRISPAGQASGMMAMGAAMANSLIVDDGKTTYVYMQAMGGYSKRPHTGGQNPAIASVMGAAGRPNAKFALAGSATIAGRPCYVIDVKAAPPGRLAQSGMKVKTTAYVDKGTGRTRQVKTVTSFPAGMMGGPRAGSNAPRSTTPSSPPMQLTTVMLVKSERLDEPISDNVFRFTPPAGAKEIKGGPMGMPGMGALGGAGAPH
jgi:outer membrane lipoprotein-sorting protein